MGPWPVARGAYCRGGGQAGKHPKLRCQLAKVAHTATAWVASDSDRDGHAGDLGFLRTFQVPVPPSRINKPICPS